ncbi:hypothetical protein Hamer_G002815 [Homarus americanus]|uniref:Uncharacterized protein n=1 Tax=Homarus americanus TaxID=6706 RepID=A0A8J5JZ80_HOMAM|nr:hypothetical protein Hamer_G002815 [Homarus americanus]
MQHATTPQINDPLSQVVQFSQGIDKVVIKGWPRTMPRALPRAAPTCNILLLTSSSSSSLYTPSQDVQSPRGPEQDPHYHKVHPRPAIIPGPVITPASTH